MKIFFIEDNPEFSKVLSRLLAIYDYEVTLCDNADDAVSAIPKLGSYDLVILDLMMRLGNVIRPEEGKETGIAIYKRIRQTNKKLPILVLTAQNKENIWHEFQGDPNVSYHHKPPNVRKLIEQIEQQ